MRRATCSCMNQGRCLWSTAVTHISQPTLVPKLGGGSSHEEDGHTFFPFPLDMPYRDVYTALFDRMSEEDV